MDFNKLYEENYRQVFKYCNSFLKNTEDAEDAAQDTFLKAYESLDSFNGDSSVTTWLTAIARNVCLTMLDKEKNKSVDTVSTTMADGTTGFLNTLEDPDTPDSHLEAVSTADGMLSAYQKLPENIQRTLYLRIVEGLLQRQVAEELGVSLNTIKSWERRGKQALMS